MCERRRFVGIVGVIVAPSRQAILDLGLRKPIDAVSPRTGKIRFSAAPGIRLRVAARGEGSEVIVECPRLSSSHGGRERAWVRHMPQRLVERQHVATIGGRRGRRRDLGLRYLYLAADRLAHLIQAPADHGPTEISEGLVPVRFGGSMAWAAVQASPVPSWSACRSPRLSAPFVAPNFPVR